MKALLTFVFVAAAIGGTPARTGDPVLAIHPAKDLDPGGQLVTVVGKDFPPDAVVQLAQCTGSPLVCQALADVTTNQNGVLSARVLVAYDFSVLNPFPEVPTCSEPTFTGDPCLLAATTREPPFVFVVAPIGFSQ